MMGYEIMYNFDKLYGAHKKCREIQALSYRDRIVQHNLCDNILAPLLENYLIYDNSACRKNKGAHFAMERLNNFFREFYKEHGSNKKAKAKVKLKIK